MNLSSTGQLPLKAVLVNYFKKTGPLWSPQNVAQYGIVREMYTLVGTSSTPLSTFRLTKGPSSGACRTCVAARTLLKKALSEPKR